MSAYLCHLFHRFTETVQCPRRSAGRPSRCADLIPEAIAFSIIAGVDPEASLCASFSITLPGSRPGLIAAATGAMALDMASMVKEHGSQYLLVATGLTGVPNHLMLAAPGRADVLRVAFGHYRLRHALAILIPMAKLPELTNVGWQVYATTAAGLAIIYGFPSITRDAAAAGRQRGAHGRVERSESGHPHRGRHGPVA